MGINSEAGGPRRRTWRSSSSGGGNDAPPSAPSSNAAAVMMATRQQGQQQQQQQQPGPNPNPNPNPNAAAAAAATRKHASCPDAVRPSLLPPPLDNDDDGGTNYRYRWLRNCIEMMRGSPATRWRAGDAGRSYSAYLQVRQECAGLCRELLAACPQQQQRSGADVERAPLDPRLLAVGGLSSSGDGSSSGPVGEPQQHPAACSSSSSSPARATWGGSSSNTPRSQKGGARVREQYLEAIRQWRGCQEALLEALRSELLAAYQRADPGVTVRDFEQLCANGSARRAALEKIMQTAAADADANTSPHHHHQQSLNLHLKRRDLGLGLGLAGLLDVCETGFGSYDLVAADLAETRRLLCDGGGDGDDAVSGMGMGMGMDLAVDVRECVISPRGNVVLEFANAGASENAPIYRFRVSSHMLAEVSPVFAGIFALYPGDSRASGGGGVGNAAAASTATAAASSLECGDGYEKIKLPPPPTRHTCSDGTEVDVYRMPQTELNEHRAMEIVLHAAHMHNEAIPRDVAFDQFVAVAAVCLRYRCTAPLELVVEHRWLPQWIHRSATKHVAGDVLDGLLLISYAFGVRRMFKRVTKSAVLGVVDEADLRARSWPRAVKEKIWAVRQAKIEQVYACCSAALQEYLRPPPPPPPPAPQRPPRPATPLSSPISDTHGNLFHNYKYNRRQSKNNNKGNNNSSNSGTTMMTTTGTSPSIPSDSGSGGCGGGGGGGGSNGNARTSIFEPASTPRCPKGSHACDAASLGWLMKTFAELEVLPNVVRSASVVGHLPPPPRRSLNQLFDSLGFIASPPPPHDGQHDNSSHHGSVCDYASALRSAINDVYNSVPGLTLYDVAGRHGLGLDRRKHDQPQAMNKKMQAMYYYHTQRESTDAVRAAREAVELRILSLLDDLGDLHAAAMVNRSFYDTYKKNELLLMRGILRRRRTSRSRTNDPRSLLPLERTRTLTAASVAVVGGGGGSGHWGNNLGNPPRQQQQQQYRQYGSVEERLSFISNGDAAPAMPATTGKDKQRKAGADPTDTPVSYFEVSDDEEEEEEEEEDGVGDASDYGDNEERDEDEEDGDMVVVVNQNRSHAHGEGKPGTTRPTTPKEAEAEEDDDHDRRASIGMVMMTREEAEEILWPPQASNNINNSNNNNSSMPAVPSSSCSPISPSPPPSYTVASTPTPAQTPAQIPTTAEIATATPGGGRQTVILPRQQHEHQEQGHQGHTAIATATATATATGPGPGPGSREKFLGGGGGGVGDFVFTEHKILLPSENKHLRETHDRLVGLRASTILRSEGMR